ncbi:MAG: hypothetical protein ABIR70_08855 [Bryobacteraceae bacterium]
MAFPEDLLEQSRHLATRERGRPRQASLRRAVSTAYYALFHLLIADAVGHWRIPAQRARLARAFEHARMRSASRQIAGSPFTDRDQAAVTHLRNVARAFDDLYEYRQTADYNNSIEWTRVEVLETVHIAEQAFASWTAVRGTTIANDYLLSLFVKERS